MLVPFLLQKKFYILDALPQPTMSWHMLMTSVQAYPPAADRWPLLLPVFECQWRFACILQKNKPRNDPGQAGMIWMVAKSCLHADCSHQSNLISFGPSSKVCLGLCWIIVLWFAVCCYDSLCCQVDNMCKTPVLSFAYISSKIGWSYWMQWAFGSRSFPLEAKICLANSTNIVLLFEALSHVTHPI